MSKRFVESIKLCTFANTELKRSERLANGGGENGFTKR